MRHLAHVKTFSTDDVAHVILYLDHRIIKNLIFFSTLDMLRKYDGSRPMLIGIPYPVVYEIPIQQKPEVTTYDENSDAMEAAHLEPLSNNELENINGLNNNNGPDYDNGPNNNNGPNNSNGPNNNNGPNNSNGQNNNNGPNNNNSPNNNNGPNNNNVPNNNNGQVNNNGRYSNGPPKQPQKLRHHPSNSQSGSQRYPIYSQIL